MALINGIFHINEKLYEGKYNPAINWNGWAIPYFTRMIALKILDEQEIGHEILGDDIITADETYSPSPNNENLYCIGGFSWTWEVQQKCKVFPNGFTSWAETHFEVISGIEAERRKDKPSLFIQHIQEAQGTKGFYELAEELTDEFERKYEGNLWDELDWYDTIEAFIQSNLYPIEV